MLNKKYIVQLLFLPALIFGQSRIDSMIQTLDSLTFLSMDNWKYTTDLSSPKSDIIQFSNPEYDDSDWKIIHLNQSVYVDSCWLRKVIHLPDFIAGCPVQGMLQFLVSVDDYGYLWVNGKEKGRFPWDGEFVLTEQATPGMDLVLLIRAINTGGPLRLIRASLTSEYLQPEQQVIRDFTLGLRVGKKLLGFDTYQTNSRVKTDPGIDKSRMDPDKKRQLNDLLINTVEKIDLDALTNGRLNDFKKSLKVVRKETAPVSDFVKQFTLFFDANAHIDAAWLWREKETIEVCNRTFSSVMNMMKIRPDFTYTQSQAAL